MYKTIGHQTIQKTQETILERLKKGPIHSPYKNQYGQVLLKPPFAGSGYYFWEDNIKAAKWFGKVRYKEKGLEYRIFKVDINLTYDDNSLLDLIGNIQHLHLFKNMINETKKSLKEKCEEWKLHQYLYYYRHLNKKINGVFPFKMVRFADDSKKYIKGDVLKLSENQNFMEINPFFIICIFEKRNIPIESYVHLE
ncbi:MAG: hypothetical protein IPO63_16205 [Bacteroidetes bacterium]|nr:hypothetical protein [Bacteroidota bacterium]